MNQSQWYSQQPYSGYEVQELENSRPANQNSTYQMHPTASHHFHGSKTANETYQQHPNSQQPTISTGHGTLHPNSLDSGKTKDQRLAAAKNRYRQIPRNEPQPSQPWPIKFEPSSVDSDHGFAVTYQGYLSTGSTGYSPQHYSSHDPFPAEYYEPSAPQQAASSFCSSPPEIQTQLTRYQNETVEETELRNEKRRCMERRRRQKDNELLARAEHSTDPIILEKAAEIRARRKRKEDRAQERYRNMSDDKRFELRQRKKRQQQLRDLKKKQEEDY